ncbi:MAG: DUF2062 domain-containing protein [Desulfobacterales bacterium]
MSEENASRKAPVGRSPAVVEVPNPTKPLSVVTAKAKADDPSAEKQMPHDPNLSKWSASLWKAYERFLKIRGNPREIGLGFALGIFVGMTPFMGMHTAIAVFLAAMLKWNKFAAAIAVWISNPLTAPFIYSATYLVGSWFVHPQRPFVLPPTFDLDALISLVKMGPGFFWVLMVGGAISGIPLAIAAYFMAFGAIVEYRKTIRQKLVKSTETLKSKLHPPNRSQRESRKKGKKKQRQ